MKELVVISGKGGTGKTSITACFASMARNMVLCDADVDAADLHLLMAPEILSRHDFQGGGQAIIQRDKCTECGLCRDLCRYDAVREDFTIDEINCEGCGVCVDFCPEHAIDFPPKTCGEYYISNTRFGPMVHARLGIAEENSGKLVTLIRGEAKEIAEKEKLDLIITDGPPGVGCPVIASIGGADLLLIVTEPTLSGLHDMERVVQLADHFNVPCMVCINKHDINSENTRLIEQFAEKKNISVLGKIPFDSVFIKSMVQGKNIIEYNGNSEAGKVIKAIWDKLMPSLIVTNEK